MKTIVLTGGLGFVGAAFVEHVLRFTDWNIVCIDRLDTSGNPNRLSDMECWEKHKTRVRIIYWDLKAEISSQVRKQIGHFDYLVHIAASSHVDRSITDPLSFVMDNVVGTAHVLEYFRNYVSDLRDASFAANYPVTLPRMLYFSTDEVFGPAPDEPYKEFDRFNPGNPYSATKAGGECLCDAYANTYGLDIMVTHCMNIFGERQHPEKFIPMVIKKVLAGETITIHADPTLTKSGTRFYLHARNVSEAVIFLLHEGQRLNGKATEGKYNVVGEKEVSNLDMAQMIADIIGKPLKYEMVNFHQSRPGHDLRYGLDGSLLKSMGFNYPVTFEESLKNTVEWTLKHPEWL